LELSARSEASLMKPSCFFGQWDDACLEFHKSQRVVRTASVIQVRRPIYRSSVGRWRHYEALLEPVLVELKSWDLPQRLHPRLGP